MQQVLSNDLWRRLRGHAARAKLRRAAIAYVTRDLVGFRKSDLLVTNAAYPVIAAGETDAKLLRSLHRRGVRIYDCPNLHAKVLLFDNLAVISSGNMSNSSAHGLVEAAMITDHVSTVSGVSSFIEQVVQESRELQSRDIAKLCKITVVRRGGWNFGGRHKIKITPIGNRTWIVGERELVRKPRPEEQRRIDRAEGFLSSRVPKKNIEWIRWRGKGKFMRECKQGDSVIQVWRSSRAKRPSVALRATPVLLKQKTKRWTRFYIQKAASEISWGRFKQLMRELGYPRRLSPGMEHLIDEETADSIQRKWKGAVRR